ncbi:MAG: QacE family quaternary ammonium compound efflux SMR transporter [Nitrospiraceae bacterium]|nr:QacE family quaternary ammonium compound efflux SMR transporter [Nitrospiraceae bacterium]
MAYTYLFMAIVAEVIGTVALKASEEFTKFLPSVVVVLGYGMAFYFLSVVLRTIPVGIAYAVWAGIGIVLIAIAGALVFKQIPDLPAIVGISLIISGVVIIYLFSKTVNHLS